MIIQYFRWLPCAGWIFIVAIASPIVAQDEVIDGGVAVGDAVIIQNGDAASVQAQINAKLQAQAAKGQTAPPPGTPPAQSGQPDASAANKPPTDGAKASGSDGLKPVLRGDEPPSTADPNELKVRPDADGMLQFQFRDQPWPVLLRWLADCAGMSLDWQELPGDTINLATKRPYSLEETKDVINRALLMRGYTILEHDNSLTVTKVEGINPSIVPRVRPDELSDLPPHSYVRTSFELTWLLAEEVHSEFASMLSKNGKLTPLMSTNRIEAMDAVGNLRDINDILTKEQSAIALGNLAEEYQLKHARASHVQANLEEFLGVQSSTSNGRSSSRGGSPEQQMMMMQMQQQMAQQQQAMQQQMQQMQQAAGGVDGAARKRSDKVYLFANDRSNTLIVHAPPNKRAIIAAFIKRVDVPNEKASDFERMKLRTKVFRLVSLSPQELVTSLTAMDILEPATRLQINEENRSLIANASLSDQYLIQEVIDRLDGSQRSLHMIQLRRLRADAVAGTIKSLMLGDESENQNQDRFRNYGYFGMGGQDNKKSEKMRVTANVQDNQLLLWVNDIELEEVRKLLERLGEVPPAGQVSTHRIIDASRRPETYEYLKRLKELWDKNSPNPLNIPEESEFRVQEEPEEDNSDVEPKTSPSPPAPRDEVTPNRDALRAKATNVSGQPSKLIATQTALVNESGGKETRAEASFPNDADVKTPEHEQPMQASPPPISIDIDDRGNLVIQSNDLAALDRLEQWMLDHKPPRREYDVFKVRFAKASWVRLSLKEYFIKKDDSSSQSNPFGFIFWDDFGSNRNNKKDDQQLGKRPELQFISDDDTNTIVVKNADDRDRATIAELIKLWDVPDPRNKKEDKARYTRLVSLKYSRANLVLNTVKEAYRDLLSANDKTFDKEADGESKRSGGSGLGISFKGKLSLGADEVSNRILVSAEGEELFNLVCDLIEELDEAAKDQGIIQVVTVGDGINAKALKDALQTILSPSKEQTEKANQQTARAEQEAAAQAQSDAQAHAAKRQVSRNADRKIDE